MAVNNIVSNLSTFLNELHDEKLYQLIQKKAPSMGLFRRDTANAPYTLNLVRTNFNGVIADGSECGAADNLETKISQRRMDIALEKFSQEICTNALMKAYTAWQTRFNAGQTEIPFEAEITADQLSQIADVVEKQIWQDVTVGGQVYRGLQYIIATDGAAPVTSAATGIIGKVDDLIAAIPYEYTGKMDLYMSRKDFLQFVFALRNSNMYDPKLWAHDAQIDSYEYMGYTIHGVPGIEKYNGQSYCYALVPENVVIATTNGTDYTDMEVISKPWDETLLFRTKFGIGKQIAFPAEEALSVQL